MSIEKIQFGEFNNSPVYLYTLDNGNGLSAEIINYGARIRKLVYKGIDVVLGKETCEDYVNDNLFFGAAVGRNANRIGRAELVIGGETYTLSANQLGNHLHGGFEGFDKKMWNATVIDGNEPSLELTYISPDGEEGYPGEVKVKITYTLTADNSLKIHYEGVSDKDTALNITNHSYFNLNGHNSGVANGHSLKVESDFYTPNGQGCLPNGEIVSVKNTPFDFTTAKVIAENIVIESEQTKPTKGFDHNFVLNGSGYRQVAELKGDITGITMQVYTDCPGMQFCGGNYIKEDLIYKDGATYPKYGGLCLETQVFPNWNSFSHFKGAILRKGEKYDSVTAYKFL